MGVIENAKDLAGLIQKYSEAGLYREYWSLRTRTVTCAVS
jgi:hypothetical protein